MDPRQAELLRAVPTDVLGARVRAHRVAKGLTQGQLAGAEVSVGYISRIEAGQRRPTVEVLRAITERLGVSLERILTGVEAHELDEIQVLLDFAQLSLESGDASTGRTQAVESLARAESSDQARLAQRARFLIARATEAHGDVDEAILAYESLIDAEPSWVQRLQIGIALCRSYREAGDLSLAIETGERLLKEAGEAGLDGSDEQVQLAVTLAAAYFERGDVNRAARACESAVRSAERLDSPKARAAAYWNAATIQARRGAMQEAVPLATRALVLMSQGNDMRNLARLRTQLGLMHLELDPPDLDQARTELVRAAQELSWSSASPAERGRNRLGQARVRLLSGDPADAREIGEAVLATADADTPATLLAMAHTLIGQSRAAEGDVSAAAASYQSASMALTAIGSDRSAAQIWYDLAELLSEVGDHDAALHAYRSAGAAVGLRHGAWTRSTIAGLRVDG
ncbi:MAG: helix-turn-helix domain-containing protein [Nocardioides sp.]